MMNEISAFAAYTISSSPKKVPNKSQKQIKNRKTKQAPKTSTKRALKPPKKTIKESPKKLNNGAGNGIKQNGVAHDKQSSNIAKMCSTSGSSSCGGSNSSFTELSNESSGDVDDLETTADMAKQMAKMVKKCAGGACNAGGASSDASDGSDASEDSDASDGSAASDDSDASDASDASDGSDNDDDSNDDDDEDEDDDAGDESDQFSVEYTPNSSNRSSSSSVSSPVAAKPPPPPPAAAARRKAQKRSGLLSDEETNDVNNNNNNKGKPQPAKQKKLQQIATELQKAPSCPLVRPAVAAAALVTGIVGAIKSCPLPSKETKKAAVKSCPLPAKTVDKMADKMAAKAKSCPLPKKNETTKLQQQQQQQQRTVKQQQQQKPETVAKARRSLQAEPPKVNEVRRSLQAEPPKHKVQKGLEQSAHKEVHLQNSIEEGKRVLSWLLNPVMADTFFTQYWEKNACLVMRKRSSYFAKLISFKMIDELLIRHHLEFTTNIDVTSYENGVRQTHNPDGRATPPTVWGFYGDGCSIRILNPSTYLSSLRQVCTVLQEYFHCLVGANVYLTPPNSQGFAPHYDDIEAFVLQVEGRKRWRLYTPPLPSDLLGRVSSGNYKQEQLGEPIFDAVLEPGDILYFPRGTVHQAVTEEKQHSLHITLSVYQQQAYANLLEELMPLVLQRAIKHHLTLRRGLPLHTWQHLGLANGGQKSEQRTQLIQGINQMVQQYLMPHESQIDAAVDQLAKRFQHEALPPVVLPEEKLRTVFGSRSETDARGHCLADYELNERTEVRLLRAHILRLVAEGTSIRVYYYVDNALEYRKYEANYMEIQPTEAPAVEALIKAYPNYLKINELPLRSIDRRIEVATALWEHGLLMTKKPFKQ